MAKCKKCQNIYNLSDENDVIVGKYCPKINDSPDIERERECEHFKPMSNADRIRAMSDEELAEFSSHYISCGYCDAKTLGGSCGTNCKQNLLKWLQSEAE